MSSTISRQRTPRPRRDEVRAGLLAAATTVFARQGVDASSVEDVARAAGFTKGAVYSNFGSKDDLVAALVADHTAAYLALGLAAADSTDGSMTAKARALGDRLDAASQDERDWHLLFVELWQRAVRGDPASAGFHERRDQLRDAIAAAVTAQAAATNSTLTLPAEHVATAIMALANGMAMERLIAPHEAPDGLTGHVLAALASTFVVPAERTA